MHIQTNSYQNNKSKLILKKVSKSYDNILVLKDISLEVNEGELVTLLGPSGSGKSTIFNIITNITNIDNGDVYIDGKISYMQQKDLLLPYKTIINNVSLPLILKKSKKSDAINRVKPYFEEFGLQGSENKYPSELSGGMRQRANFLRTFINSKDLMLLDEPFGALDSITKSNMQKWLLKVRKKFNSTIMLITHDIEEAITLSDRIYVISDKPSTIKAEFILDNKCNYEFGSSNYINLKKDILNLL